MPLTATRTAPAPRLLIPAIADERAARASLRTQIARLERRLGLLAMELWDSGETRPVPAGPNHGAARMLSLGELEEIRDGLVAQVEAARTALRDRASEQADARARLDAMLADPASHRYEIVHHTQLGERSCGAYHVLPRLGVLGMLFGWWCVKLSSGCP
jgi:hypothetical protein